MPSSRRPSPPEFREEAVRLVREHGKPMAAVARDLGVSVESLRQWIQRAEVEEGKREGLTEAERDELRRLRRENRVLRDYPANVPQGHPMLLWTPVFVLPVS